MFKNLIVFRIAQGWAADLAAIEEALAKVPFIECEAIAARALAAKAEYLRSLSAVAA